MIREYICENSWYRSVSAKIIESIHRNDHSRALNPDNENSRSGSGQRCQRRQKHLKHDHISSLDIIFIFGRKKNYLCHPLQPVAAQTLQGGKQAFGLSNKSNWESASKRSADRSQSLFFWIKKKERILNGYLLRSVDRTSERSTFNNENVKK